VQLLVEPVLISPFPHVLNVEELLPLPKVIKLLDATAWRSWFAFAVVERPRAYDASGHQTTKNDSRDEFFHGALLVCHP